MFLTQAFKLMSRGSLEVTTLSKHFCVLENLDGNEKPFYCSRRNIMDNLDSLNITNTKVFSFDLYGSYGSLDYGLEFGLFYEPVVVDDYEIKQEFLFNYGDCKNIKVYSNGSGYVLPQGSPIKFFRQYNFAEANVWLQYAQCNYVGADSLTTKSLLFNSFNKVAVFIYGSSVRAPKAFNEVNLDTRPTVFTDSVFTNYDVFVFSSDYCLVQRNSIKQ